MTWEEERERERVILEDDMTKLDRSILLAVQRVGLETKELTSRRRRDTKRPRAVRSGGSKNHKSVLIHDGLHWFHSHFLLLYSFFLQ